ncbi:MAG: hypothetical protein WB565_18775 [Acidimicrobiales bacterium]
MSPEASAEGWYKDPYGEHEARWFSNGTPTSLVRDGSVESRHEPPERSVDGPLERVEPSQTRTGGDLRRADDAEAEYQSDYKDKASEAMDKGGY